MADDILDELKNTKDAQLESLDIKNAENYLFSSAINTAILSVLIGWEVGLNSEMIRQLFIGAIFHDIGMALLDPAVTYKRGELTREEKNCCFDASKKRTCIFKKFIHSSVHTLKPLRFSIMNI